MRFSQRLILFLDTLPRKLRYPSGTKPRSSAAAIHRRIGNMAKAEGWPVPSYSTVYAILANLDPSMVTLAHYGTSAFRNRYELVHRHRAETANAIWQADRTMLDLPILDQAGEPVRPWLTIVMDDYSRAFAGIMVFAGAPSILNASLALRQAIWCKGDPAWLVRGIPDVLYADHGCDFTSKHLDRVTASLKFRIVYSAVARPQGRGKIERLFGALNSELLPELSGHPVKGKPASASKLSLAELDRAITAYVANTYNVRAHSDPRASCAAGPPNRTAGIGQPSVARLDMERLPHPRPIAMTGSAQGEVGSAGNDQVRISGPVS